MKRLLEDLPALDPVALTRVPTANVKHLRAGAKRHEDHELVYSASGLRGTDRPAIEGGKQCC